MKILHDRYGKIALLVFSNICYNFIVTIYFYSFCWAGIKEMLIGVMFTM